MLSAEWRKHPEAHLATKDGTEKIKLELSQFLYTANPFCVQVGHHTSRTMFLRKFANLLPMLCIQGVNSSKSETLPQEMTNDTSVTQDDKLNSSAVQAGNDPKSVPQEMTKDTSMHQNEESSNSAEQAGQVSSREDECSPASLKKHQIGENLRIRLDLLVEPPVPRQVRPLDIKHTKKLQKDINRNPDCNFTKMLLHIRKNPSEVNIQELNSGDYTFEVLGGNHTRHAMQSSGLGDIFIDACVYAGLSDGQALCLGLQHNLQHKGAKPMSFTNYVLKFQEHWMKQTENLESPTQKERTIFKDYLAKILRVPRKTINNSYRHHIFMATLAPRIWAKAKQLLSLWEEGTIVDQLKRPFNQCDCMVLESCDNLEQCLQQLCQKELSWKELRTTSAKPSGGNKNGLEKIGALQDLVKSLEAGNKALSEEVRLLKRENDSANEEIRLLRRKLEEAEKRCIEKDTDDQEEEVISVEAGEWVGVVYESRCYLGRVKTLLGDGHIQVQFLTGRIQGRLNKRDIQSVERQFVVTKINNVKASNGVYSLSQEEVFRLEKAFQNYRNKCI